MELADRSAGDLLAVTDGGLPDAPRLITEICAGLAHLHSAGWVHGDLKPGNVLLMPDGSVRLADFGLARGGGGRDRRGRRRRGRGRHDLWLRGGLRLHLPGRHLQLQPDPEVLQLRLPQPEQRLRLQDHLQQPDRQCEGPDLPELRRHQLRR
ncbi:MAG TPA: protein kinase [Actinoplanes sp.]|nr:protein kinase [Actinoplanes sp.]